MQQTKVTHIMYAILTRLLILHVENCIITFLPSKIVKVKREYDSVLAEP